MSKASRRLIRRDRRIEAYASWIQGLSAGRHVPPPRARGGGPVAALGRELEHLAELLDRRETELRHLLEVIRQAERGVLLEDVLDRIFDSFTGLIPFERLGCAFLSPDAAVLTAYWARSKLGAAQIGKGFAQPMKDSSLQEILASGRPRIINDLGEHLRLHPQSESTRRIVAEGGRSSLTCPLIIEGNPIGFLFFTSWRVGTYRDLHQDLFLQIAALVAVVIDKSRLLERLLEDNQMLAERGKKLQEEATVDPLTRISNRRGMQEIMASELARAAERALPVAFIMADIDLFKRINDTYGHPAGDELLKAFAHRVAQALRSGDRIARYGGEEFLAIAVGADKARGVEIAERLRHAVAGQPFTLGGKDVPITASFGVASTTPLPADGDALLAEGNALVAAADAALYAAKKAGRNCVMAAP